MASLPGYISAEEVVELLQRQDPNTIIIDVRDEDFFEGHIKGAQQVPSGKFGSETNVDDVIKKLPAGTNLVIVHCQLSQVRGPKCARRLAERLVDCDWSRQHAKPEVKVLRYGYEGFYDQMYGNFPQLFQGIQ